MIVSEVDAVDVVATAVHELHMAMAAVDDARDRLNNLVATCDASDENVVEMYWSFPEIQSAPLAARLGYSHASVAAQRGAWGSVQVGECAYCGVAIEGRSRSAATGDWKTRCAECLQGWIDANAQQWREECEEHAKAIVELRQMPYGEYLRTQHWNAVRLAALRRARWRCQVCNVSGRLDVHHRTYENRGDEQASDVIALCRSCHARHHGKETV